MSTEPEYASADVMAEIVRLRTRQDTIAAHCRGHLELPGSCCPHLAQEILAVIGTGEENK